MESSGLTEPRAVIYCRPNPISKSASGSAWTDVLLVILCINLVIIALNIVSSDLTPPVTLAEVMFTDPATNLSNGLGFRTTAWYTQPFDRLYASNAPLYSLLLAGWIKLFGFGIISVRSLNYLIMGLAVSLLCINIRRISLSKNNFIIAGFILLVWMGEATSLAYRTGRYDALCILVLVLAWSASLIRRQGLRHASLFAVGAITPLSGYHLVPYMMLTGLVLPLIRMPGKWKSFAVFGAGMAFGLLGLIVACHLLGVLDVLVGSVLHHSPLSPASDRNKQVLRALTVDMSSHCLLVTLLLLAAVRGCGKGWAACRLELIGLFYLLAVPAAFGLMRIAQDYYSWMKYIPACVCVVLSIGQLDVRGSRRFVSYRLALFFAAIAMVGFPARLAMAAVDAKGFRYKPLMEFVEQHVQPDDWALISPEPYYPAMRNANRVFISSYRNFLLPSEMDRINVLIANPDDEHLFLQTIAGDWTPVGTYDPMDLFRDGSRRKIGWPPYQLNAYRRQVNVPSLE